MCLCCTAIGVCADAHAVFPQQKLCNVGLVKPEVANVLLKSKFLKKKTSF